MNGHSIGQYRIHAGKTVPIVKGGEQTKMEVHSSFFGESTFFEKSMFFGVSRVFMVKPVIFPKHIDSTKNSELSRKTAFLAFFGFIIMRDEFRKTKSMLSRLLVQQERATCMMIWRRHII